MALDQNRLATAIVDALDAAGAYDDSLDKNAAKSDSEDKLKIIVGEIISEFQANAEVDTTVSTTEDAVTSVSVDPNTGLGATTQKQTSSGTGTGGIT